MRHVLIAVGAAAVACSGPSWAQYAPETAKSGQKEHQKTATPCFLKADTILDASAVARAGGEQTADIDDLVVDTRNGRIAYAIVDTNGILCSDDKTVAIPYGALSWDVGQERFTLDVTLEELSNLPAWDAGDIAQLHGESWLSQLTGIFGDRPELHELENMSGDEYTTYFTETRPEQFEGRIVAVNRQVRTTGGDTFYAVDVEDNARKERHTVLLAPVAYVTRQTTVPAEGNQVTVTTIRAVNDQGEMVCVAQDIKVDGKTLRLRDAKGVPAWELDPARSFYKFASDMDEGELRTQGGEVFGSINDAVFEVHSGTAAFAIISVGGVLGIDDTLYPVPCKAVTCDGKANLYIDMPVSKLKMGPKLSEDGIADLNDKQFAKRVCEYYEVHPKQYETGRSARWPTSKRTASGS